MCGLAVNPVEGSLLDLKGAPIPVERAEFYGLFNVTTSSWLPLRFPFSQAPISFYPKAVDQNCMVGVPWPPHELRPSNEILGGEAVVEQSKWWPHRIELGNWRYDRLLMAGVRHNTRLWQHKVESARLGPRQKLHSLTGVSVLSVWQADGVTLVSRQPVNIKVTLHNDWPSLLVAANC